MPSSIFSSGAGVAAGAGAAATTGAAAAGAGAGSAAGAGAAALGFDSITTINFLSSMLYLERGSSSTEITIFLVRVYGLLT